MAGKGSCITNKYIEVETMTQKEKENILENIGMTFFVALLFATWYFLPRFIAWTVTAGIF